jgi:hypothetical protein
MHAKSIMDLFDSNSSSILHISLQPSTIQTRSEEDRPINGQSSQKPQHIESLLISFEPRDSANQSTQQVQRFLQSIQMD